MKFQKTRLPSGIRVVSERHPHANAVSIGVWIQRGSRDEPIDAHGLFHFIEHMAFKRTKSFNSFEIAKSLEELGGDLNAFTTREYTCFHALVLRQHWKKALFVLSELTQKMRIQPKDFLLEKSVITQEIGMAEEQPEEIIYDYFFESVYEGNGLAFPIAGTTKSVMGLSIPEVKSYYESVYQGANLIVSACGNLDHTVFINECNIRFSNLKIEKKILPERIPPVWKKSWQIYHKPIDHSHVLMGLPIGGFHSSDRFLAMIANALLGGSMTSRLFQAIREKRGLVYSIHSQLATHTDSGSLLLYASCERDHIEEVAFLMKKELLRLRRQKVSTSELSLFKKQLIGQILLNSDEIESRMNSLAINEMVFGKHHSVSWVVDQVRSTTKTKLNLWLEEYLDLSQLSGILITSEKEGDRNWWKRMGGSK